VLRIRIDIIADPDPFFCLNADPDPGSQTDLDPDPVQSFAVTKVVEFLH
jgi:hypothetical protein